LLKLKADCSGGKVEHRDLEAFDHYL
jgi:peptidoglycan hydrolase-like protein with peptidoglycan-binding domain